MKKVEIEWIDSRQVHGWNYMEEIDCSACHIKSCGYLIQENEECVVLALSVGDNPFQACGINVIPKCCIIKMEDGV